MARRGGETLLFGLIAFLLAAAPTLAIADASPQTSGRPVTLWPFFAHESSPDKARTEVLWPLSVYKRDGSRTEYT